MTVIHATFGRPSGPLAERLSAETIAAAIRGGQLPADDVFDALLPADLRQASHAFWTPVAVAARAAEWLHQLEVRTVLDVGSGVGKFCVVAALSGRCRFVGVEHRSRLVPLASQLAADLGVSDRVSFLEGTLGVTPLPIVEAYYFYNPFGENVYGPEDHLDETVEVAPKRFGRDITAALRLLEAAPEGTYLVTYNGFGAHAPPSYRELCLETHGASELGLWRRERRTGP